MCIRCGVVNLSNDLESLEPELKRIAKLIHAGKLQPGQIDQAMVSKIAGEIMKGFFKGYGKSLDAKNLTDAERTFLNQITNNVFVFSGFKNYQQLKETSLLLKTDTGQIKPFKQFLNDVKQVNKTYNEVYLSAEYGNAIASAQMAQAWQDFKTNGVKMLTYQTAGDDRVRAEHAILDGIRLPLDDPFWSTHYPPNDWGCRCDAVPSVDTEKISVPASSLPKMPAMFKNNVGESGILFPSTHPYFDVNANEAKRVYQQVKEIIPETSKNSYTPDNLDKYETRYDVTVDKEVFDYLNKDTPLVHLKGSAHYNPTTNTVSIPLDNRRKNSKWKAESVVYHEYGHAADWQNGYRKLDFVKELMAEYKSKYNLKSLSDTMTEEVYTAIKNKDHDVIEQLGAAMDTVMALDKRYGAGHRYKVKVGRSRVDYFSVAGFKEAEFIAHAFENKFIGNSLFKKHMPELYDAMISMVEDFKRK